MFSALPERLMHRIRIGLTIGWVILIISLFYDPISPMLTDPGNTFSPLRLDLSACVKVQGVCLKETPYPIAARLFWATIVPASVFILLVFGHDFWRRICPLSFLSQIPRALGWRHQRLVQENSWLHRNHLYLQFSLLYLGVSARILFVNSNRWALGFLLIATIGTAISVGFRYGGKTWCNYLCPMASVQTFYGEPRGLLTHPAHQDKQHITQSMCRTVTPTGQEQSACVAC